MTRAEQFLIQYRKAVNKVRLLELELEDIRAETEQITQVMSADRVQTSHVADRFGEQVARLADKQNEIEEAILMKSDMLLLIYSVIEQVDDVNCQILLQERYIHFKTWLKVSKSIDCSEREVYTLRQKAFREVEKLI